MVDKPQAAMQLPSAYERVTSSLPFVALPEKKRILAEYLEDRSVHFGWELYRHSGEQGPSKHADFILVDREQVGNLRSLVVLIKFTKSTRAKPTTDEVSVGTRLAMRAYTVGAQRRTSCRNRSTKCMHILWSG